MNNPVNGYETPNTMYPNSMGQQTPLSNNPALNVIKTIGSSPKFLIMAILYTVSVVLSVVTSLSASTLSNQITTTIYSSMGMDPDYYAYTNGATGIVSAVSGSVPTILICVAIWLHYFTCRNRESGNISTAGLTIFKVFLTIGMVGLIIGTVGLVIGFFAILSLGSSGMSMMDYELSEFDFGVPGSASAAIGAVFAIALVVIIFAFFYIGAMLKLVKRAKQVSMTGVPDNKVSRFLITMFWISGISSALIGIGSLFSSPLTGISTILAAVFNILTALTTAQYRKEMTAVMYQPAYGQPAYWQQPQQPVQPVQPVQPAYQQPPQPVYTRPAAPVAPPQPVQQQVPQPVPQPVQQQVPVQPVAPVQFPAEPVKPELTIDPVIPVEPSEPITPELTVETDFPSAPETPAEHAPAAPEAPEAPAENTDAE